jgi:hypothetical protein
VPPLKKIQIYIEIGKQRVFAGAVDWPGWTRSGRNAESATRALVEYGARYARAIESAQLEFQPPADDSTLTVIERLKGDTTTDFGAPGTPPKSDSKPMDADLLRRSEAILKSCWRTFDRAVRAAGEKALRKGPRGGGRELDEIVRHILEADAAYLAKIVGRSGRMQPPIRQRNCAGPAVRFWKAWPPPLAANCLCAGHGEGCDGHRDTSSAGSPGTHWIMLGRSKTARNDLN